MKLSIKKINLKTIGLFVLLFFWFFSPVIKISDSIRLKTYILTVVIPAYWGVKELKKNGGSYLTNRTLILISAVFLYIFLFEIIFFIFGDFDFNFSKECIIGFFIYFSAYFIVSLYRKYYDDYLNVILRHLFFVGVIHSIFILFTAVFPDFTEFIYNIIWVTPKAERYLFGDVFNRRYPGLLDTGFAPLSSTHATLLSLGLFDFIRRKNVNFKITILYASSFLLIFGSILFTGRSGFVVLGLYIFLFIFLYTFKYLITLRISKKLIMIITIVVFLITIVILNVDYKKYENIIKASFEFIFNFFETGSFSTYSTDIILENQMIFPSNIIEFLFGSGNFGRGVNRIPSDLGIVYFMNGIGLLGTIFAFSFFFLLPIRIYKLGSKYREFLFFILVYLINLILLNFKDLYYLGFIGVIKIFFVFLFCFHYIEKDVCVDKCTFG